MVSPGWCGAFLYITAALCQKMKCPGTTTPQLSWRSGMSHRLMGDPSCRSSCREAMSAGFMRWTSNQSARSDADSGVESTRLENKAGAGL
ncbi:hypothetical protein GDO81_018796 [Engystomops pustulosus]|uniref:Secreted protein n=1 Tax=Engystomops pustulosus TaxID=76066 RepID=A0AAV6YAR3_ENGPU|nr:hypothetical protein GDO81_018796 [Engystomops pustulosus]